MKKIILGAILVLLVTIGGGVFFLLSNLDDLVKSAIETYGSQATQTRVQVNSVKIGLQDGSGAIYGLRVGNPPGFSAPQVFSLGEISTQLDLDSISREVVVIKQITVRGPEVFFELNEAGKTNLDALKQNMSSPAGSGSTGRASSASESGPQPKLLIRNLLFADGKIHARVVPLNKDYELNLPEIELANLGGTQGATPQQIAEQILKVLTDRSLAEIQKQGIDQYKAQLKNEVNKRLDAEKKKLDKKIRDKVGDQIGDQLGDKLKGLLNN